jgi:hypothetical protein
VICAVEAHVRGHLQAGFNGRDGFDDDDDA